ncbi:hypothetical protein YYC_05329 [Plasmodium yoelii 17X]|uniref:Uncharacterized protein n=1 Tax=Plasmodium yoelii 17X TaxID=1323249 RepID=V7PBP1_PLAYE|nr:hypothetical protein YYC_05329 [Plasmodium yoelii 17X]
MNCIRKFLYTLNFIGLLLLSLNNYIFQSSLLNGERKGLEAIRSLGEFSTLFSRKNEKLPSGALTIDDESEEDIELKNVLTGIASRANELLKKGNENVKSRLNNVLNEEISKILKESENFMKEEKNNIEMKKEKILNGEVHRTRMLMKKLAKKRIIIWEDSNELVMIEDLYELIDDMLIDKAAKIRLKELARKFINSKSPFDHVEIYKEIKKYTKSERSRNKKPLNINKIFGYFKTTKIGKILSNPFVILELAKHISLDTFLHFCLDAVEKVSRFILPSITMFFIILYYVIANKKYLKSLVIKNNKNQQNGAKENIIEIEESKIKIEKNKIKTKEKITGTKKTHGMNVKGESETNTEDTMDEKNINIIKVTIYMSKKI